MGKLQRSTRSLGAACGYALYGASLSLSSVAVAQTNDPSITLAGTRNIQIGSPVAKVISKYSLEALGASEDTSSCGATSYSYPPLDVEILAIDGRVSRLRIEAQYDNIPEISYRTPEGIRLGSTVAEVRRAFPKAEERVEQNGGRLQIYAWQKVDQSGYLFEVSPDTKRVVALAVGDKSLRFYEGCY